MTVADKAWFCRHRAVVFASVGAVALIAGGLALGSAVQRARFAARRTSDL
jgi:hypothetical protein